MYISSEIVFIYDAVELLAKKIINVNVGKTYCQAYNDLKANSEIQMNLNAVEKMKKLIKEKARSNESCQNEINKLKQLNATLNEYETVQKFKNAEAAFNELLNDIMNELFQPILGNIRAEQKCICHNKETKCEK